MKLGSTPRLTSIKSSSELLPWIGSLAVSVSSPPYLYLANWKVADPIRLDGKPRQHRHRAPYPAPTPAPQIALPPLPTQAPISLSGIFDVSRDFSYSFSNIFTSPSSSIETNESVGAAMVDQTMNTTIYSECVPMDCPVPALLLTLPSSESNALVNPEDDQNLDMLSPTFPYFHSQRELVDEESSQTSFFFTPESSVKKSIRQRMRKVARHFSIKEKKNQDAQVQVENMQPSKASRRPTLRRLLGRS